VTLINAVAPAPELEQQWAEYGEVIVSKKTRCGQSAKTLPLLLGAAALAVALATQPAAAQIGMGHASMAGSAAGLHFANPSLSLSAPANSPLQSQVRDDYATTLMSSQRQLLQQNPSGDSPAELSVGSQLDGFTGPR
jgi:hypothetical protein